MHCLGKWKTIHDFAGLPRFNSGTCARLNARRTDDTASSWRAAAAVTV